MAQWHPVVLASLQKHSNYCSGLTCKYIWTLCTVQSPTIFTLTQHPTNASCVGCSLASLELCWVMSNRRWDWSHQRICTMSEYEDSAGHCYWSAWTALCHDPLTLPVQPLMLITGSHHQQSSKMCQAPTAGGICRVRVRVKIVGRTVQYTESICLCTCRPLQ